MKFKKLAILATAAMLSASVGVPAIAESNVEASTFSDDIHTVASDIRARNAITAAKTVAGIAGLVATGAAIYHRGHEIDKAVQNHASFHLKVKKVYLLYKNGKKAGKKYVLRRGGNTYVQSWVVPKKTYKVKGMKCYKIGKTKSGKNLYLPVKYTAYTHVVD